jgi:hypothetical protein
MEKIVDDRLEENIITITRASTYHNQVILIKICFQIMFLKPSRLINQIPRGNKFYGLL